MYKVNWYTLCWNENDIVKYVKQLIDISNL